MNKRNIGIIIGIIIVCIGIVLLIIGRKANKEKIVLDNDFNINIIKTFNKLDGNKNYLISPYNIYLALNMLRDGASGKTKDEIDKVLNNDKINNLLVKYKIGVANGVFIKDIYKNNVKKNYYDILKNKYNSDIIYDEFTSPDKINNWVSEKTYGMIPSILDRMDKNYVMGLASALAIDVKWLDSFECIRTTSEEFTKINNDKINVEMMHKSFDTDYFKYINEEDIKGIILPYEKIDNNIDLEFIGLIPEDINTYINSLTKDKLDKIIQSAKASSDKIHVNLSIPRFSYDYDANDFMDILKELGIHEAFDPDLANFTKMIEIAENIYVGEAIHKTHIELNEVGTKAAAVTYFGMFKNSAMIDQNYKEINITFNKPFIYLIREKNTGEILFFGTVYEPNLWNSSTCSK